LHSQIDESGASYKYKTKKITWCVFMKNITKESNYSKTTMFVEMNSSNRESLDSARMNLEEKLTNLGGELVARKYQSNSGTNESVMAIYFESEWNMSKAIDALKTENLLRSEGRHIKIAESQAEKDKLSAKYFNRGAEELVNDYIYETRWD
jgi:hypothetical protein